MYPRGHTESPALFNTLINSWDDGAQGTLSKFASNTKLERVAGVPEVVYPSRGTSEGCRNGQQEPHGVQQREMPNPPPGEEKMQAPGRAGNHPVGKQLDGKGSVGAAEHQIEHEPATYSWGQGHWNPGLHWTKYCQQAQRDDPTYSVLPRQNLGFCVPSLVQTVRPTVPHGMLPASSLTAPHQHNFMHFVPSSLKDTFQPKPFKDFVC